MEAVKLNFGETEPHVLQKIPKEAQERVQHIEKMGEMIVEEPLKTLRFKGYAVLFKWENGKTGASLMVIDSLGRRFLGKAPVLNECTPDDGMKFCKDEWNKIEENPDKVNSDSRFWERVGSGWPRITRR